MYNKSGHDIVRGLSFSHEAHNKRLSVLDVFSLIGNTPFGLDKMGGAAECRRQVMITGYTAVKEPVRNFVKTTESLAFIEFV